ncbi:hypothetical protein PAF17_17910 [Paracoccus sp. Z330]|uniref:Stress-induced protein n=1 Tax=Paracoccus onchidii TaxID=3017813 RepID=A0ABT4ZK46_9RHOB|nr:hypothetical protein [Paracoccus onchidii]MDB6179363.1 hypothetical protein [Paracoccus onchidii]
MAERLGSKDGTRDTDLILGKDPESAGPQSTPAQGGSTGGSLARAIGSEDELKHAEGRQTGTTRVHKADEPKPGTSNLGKENR